MGNPPVSDAFVLQRQSAIRFVGAESYCESGQLSDQYGLFISATLEMQS